MFRLIFAVIYSLVFLSVTGIPSTVLAVSCNEIIPGTTYRYADALAFFTEHNGKTYAISKSAATGITASPDGYFAFSADISQEYKVAGTDIGSLKQMVALGKYGAAKPVTIDSIATQDFIIQKFGTYLGSSTSGQSTYIDAWKEFGAGVGFTTIDGAALPYNSLTSGGRIEYNGILPQAVVIGADGVWSSGQDGIRTSQIVEFPEVLDCALSPIDPNAITPPPQPPPPPTDPNAISNVMCGQDLNGNGYTTDPGELANCIQTAQGQFCPVSSTKCVETYSPPICPGGSVLETTRDMCQAAATTVCGNGYIWDSTIDKCTKSVLCPENGTFNPVTDRCEKLVQNDCSVGYTYDANPTSPTYDRCVKSAACSDGGSFVAAKDRCEKVWMPVCDIANGYTYNAQAGVCQRMPTCTYGSYNASYNLCALPIVPSCPSGYSYSTSRSRCEKAPECPSGTTYNSVTNKCDAITAAPVQQVLACSPTSFLCIPGSSSCCNINISCPNGAQGQVAVNAQYCCLGSDSATFQSPAELLTRKELTSTGYALSALQCDSAGNCSYYFMDRYCSDGSPASAWALAGNFTMASMQSVCSPGQTLINGNQCLAATNPTCSGGNFDSNLDVCWTTYSPTCSQGTYDSATGLCTLAPSCPNGTLNISSDLCEAIISKDCGSYSLDPGANICFSAPVCASGAYDPNLNVCQSSISRNCGSYSWSQSDFKCLLGVTCPQDPAFSLKATTTFSTSLDMCITDAQHDCPAGTTYTPLPTGKCEAIPVCSGAGVYDPQKDSCFGGFNTCPLGTQFTCMDYQGVMQCSPNPCINPAAPGAETTTTLDESMLQDDARDANGNCLGQLYIFNGKASRCRPPGLTVGLLNDCCESDEAMSEDTGNTLSTAVSAIQTAYEIGQVAYYSSMVTSGAATLTPLVGTTSVGIVTATGSTTLVSGSVASGVSAAAASGSTGAAAVSSGLQAYAGALLNPATIVIAVVVLVAMKVLFGNGCDQGDIQTGMQAKAKDCHHVGDYCQKRYKFIGCVQKAKGYCCFNSKMARIIHEQGRPQLTAFQPNGDWGSPSSPNCRGLTPDEFQALDFSRIDLSEYFSDIQKDLTNKIQGAQQTITNNINTKYQKVTQ